MKVTVIDPCSSPEWMAFVGAHPDATIFHHPAWMQTLRAVYGYRIFAVCLKDGPAIRAGIPFADVRSSITGNRWVSLPFADHCQPLLDHADPSASKALLDYLKLSQGSETPRIVLHWDVESLQPTYRQNGFVIHTLDLDQPDAASVFKSLARRAKQNVRHAERVGVTVRECATWKECETFYELQVMTRRRLGVPVQPVSLFRGVWDHIVASGMGFVLLAYKDQTPIAGGVFFCFKSFVHYKYSASDPRYKALQGNAALLWHALERAIARGASHLDFGRSATADAGLCHFKRGWGATETALPYTILADHAPKAGPSHLDGIVGAVIRHSPEFVCRLTGQLLYKHFA